MAKSATDVDKKKHFAVKCQSSCTKQYTKQKVHNVKETQESDSEADFMTIAQDKRMQSDTVAAQMEIVHSGKRVKFQIDIGATINAIQDILYQT